VKVVQSVAKKNCITRTRMDIQGRKRARSRYRQRKVGHVATASLFGIRDELLRFRHGLARGFSNDIVA
jgi:hypothetical protein